VQAATPDALRGRVSAVHMLFVGASAELGGFESGLVASMIGTVPCVVVGGVGVLLAVALWDRAFPTLRRLDRMPTGGLGDEFRERDGESTGCGAKLPAANHTRAEMHD
jgi:hypothetical protein